MTIMILVIMIIVSRGIGRILLHAGVCEYGHGYSAEGGAVDEGCSGLG